MSTEILEVPAEQTSLWGETPYEGIYRRYGAGIESLRTRAQLMTKVRQVGRGFGSSAGDFDLWIEVLLGEDLDSQHPTMSGRRAQARIAFNLHVTQSGHVLSPSIEEGTLAVASKESGEITRFQLKQEDARTLVQRVILQLAFAALQGQAPHLTVETSSVLSAEHKAGKHRSQEQCYDCRLDLHSGEYLLEHVQACSSLKVEESTSRDYYCDSCAEDLLRREYTCEHHRVVVLACRTCPPEDSPQRIFW